MMNAHPVSVPQRPSASHGLGLEQAEAAGVWVGRRLRSHQFPALSPTGHGFQVTHPAAGARVPLTDSSSLGYGANSYILMRFPLTVQTTFMPEQERKVLLQSEALLGTGLCESFKVLSFKCILSGSRQSWPWLFLGSCAVHDLLQPGVG